MDCQITSHDHTADVTVTGRLDSSWTPFLSDRLDEVVRSGVYEVRLDLTGLTYLSSTGIALLVRYHRQMRQIGGSFRIVGDSETVRDVLRLTGVARLFYEEPAPVQAPGASGGSGRSVDRPEMTLSVFAPAGRPTASALELIGDPTRLAQGGYRESDERLWRAEPGVMAIGLGALGPSFDACRQRFGDFLAASGVATYRPGAGQGHPDFEAASGAFVPQMRLLYGLSFRMGASAVMARFEPRVEPELGEVTLSSLAEACLDLVDAATVGVVLVGESAGLVGSALRQSPLSMDSGLDPFDQRAARDWFSLTAEPEFARSTTLVVGVASRRPGPELSPFVRPLALATAPTLQGHFHATVVPYRPLPRGSLDLNAVLKLIFESGRIDSLLHLLNDSRPIVGVGESTFTRGVFWVVPLSVDGEAKSS